MIISTCESETIGTLESEFKTHKISTCESEFKTHKISTCESETITLYVMQTLKSVHVNQKSRQYTDISK